MRKLTAVILAVLIAMVIVPNVVSRPFATTVTVFPSSDTDVGTNGNQSYMGARSGADCLDCSSSGIVTAEHSVGAVTGTPLYSIIRGAVAFDTSFLGADATVLSASLFLKSSNVHFDYTGSDTIRITTVAATGNGGTGLGDFTTFGSAALGEIAVANIQSEQYAEIPLNVNAISKTGITRLGVRTGADSLAQQPQLGSDPNFPGAGGTVVFFYSSETAGTGSDPKLVVTFNTGINQFSASIIASKLSGTVPLTVQFSLNANQQVSSVTWRLNGVDFSNQLAPSLTFNQPGNFKIDAVVSSGNVTVTATVFITVTVCTCP